MDHNKSLKPSRLLLLIYITFGTLKNTFSEFFFFFAAHSLIQNYHLGSAFHSLWVTPILRRRH